jgi:hypothetical protein
MANPLKQQADIRQVGFVVNLRKNVILANPCFLALPIEIPFSASGLCLLILRLRSGTRTVLVHCSIQH